MTISELAAFCSSHQISAKPVFLGCHCGSVAGKEFMIWGRWPWVWHQHWRELFWHHQRKLGHGNPLPIASSQLWMTLSGPLAWTLNEVFRDRKRRTVWVWAVPPCSSRFFFLATQKIKCTKEQLDPKNPGGTALKVFLTIEGGTRSCIFLLHRCFVSRC